MNDTLVIPFFQEDIELDGVISENILDKIEPFPMTMYSPVFEGPIIQNTEIKVFYNAAYLYMAASMFDNEPEKIQATGLNRDGIQMTNNWVGILLDSYNDKENFLSFFTNPEGIRTDFVIYNDAEGVSPFQISWNAF